LIGRTISHFRILEHLGDGGMGVVYRAEDVKLHRHVALKFLPPELSQSPEAKRRLTLEATALSSLQHKNICVIHEIDETGDGQLFIAMEFLEGETLRKIIESGPLPLDRILIIATEVAQGLSAAHQRGMVHRDIKPANIILTRDHSVKILDFGLASIAGGDAHPGDADVSGTVAYMSPEQTRGEQVDHRTDVWSLGVVMYEMVTGQHPFGGKYDHATVYSIMNERHRPVSNLRADTPPALEKIIDRCLEKSPGARYDTMESLLKDVQRIAPTAKRTKEAADKSVAVLPFSDISQEKDNAYFTDGLTEEIVTKLSKVRNLKILPLPSVISYDRTGKSIRQIASDLGVGYLLQGSVRKHGADLRVSTQLIKADQEAILWAETQDGTMEKVFAIQEHVANRVVSALKLRLTPTERRSLSRRATEDTEAFQLYLRGRFFWNKRTKDSFWAAIRFFEQAIEKDPGYAPAWAGIADSYNLLVEHNQNARRELYSKAITAARKALEYDDRLAEAHTSLGMLLMVTEWDWPGSEKEYTSAIRLNPNYSTAHHWYAESLICQARFSEAIEHISIAEKLDPLSPAILKDKGMILYYARDYDAAVTYAHKALELDKEFVTAHRTLSLAYQGKGMFPESIQEHRRWSEGLGRSEEALAAHAQCLAAAGMRQEAEAILEGFSAQIPLNGNQCRSIALAHAALGSIDEAFLWLERAYERRAESLTLLKVDPKLDPLRGDSRFESLLARVGLKP
jgi:serine/threonine protein kinase/tetratricopeptide (TPR) repeat protein